MKDHTYDDIGDMRRPEKFDYTDIMEHGRPIHEKYDEFYQKHPFMSISKRAKIFAPFDALKGFGEPDEEEDIS